MRWEELNGDEFPRAVETSRGTCVICLSAIERHGPHMPLGTDLLHGMHVCVEAAKREPAVVFPPWYLGQIYEATCFPGTIAIPPDLLLSVTMAVLDEIGRNGFTKVIGYCSHGGNIHMGRFLAQCMLSKPRPYQFYAFNFNDGWSGKQQRVWRRTLVTDGGGHAGEWETSCLMAHRPDLVKLETAGDDGWRRRKRMDHVRPGFSGFWWYGDYPEHWSGDARPSSSEKGKKLTEIQVSALAEYIGKVKNDDVTPGLAEEFFERERRIRRPGRGPEPDEPRSGSAA